MPCWPPGTAAWHDGNGGGGFLLCPPAKTLACVRTGSYIFIVHNHVAPPTPRALSMGLCAGFQGTRGLSMPHVFLSQ